MGLVASAYRWKAVPGARQTPRSKTQQEPRVPTKRGHCFASWCVLLRSHSMVPALRWHLLDWALPAHP